MGEECDRVNAYFISVDPERDTDAAMKDLSVSSFRSASERSDGDPDAVRR